MSSPEKKRKKKTTEKTLLNPSPVLPILPLPEDLILNCIARLSRLYYQSLSLVSKSCRTLLASPELYKTRSLSDRTESCLYVCIQFRLDPNPNPRWFTLCRRPLTKKKKKLSGNLLVPVPSPHSTPLRSSCLAVGSDIYEIGGLINDVPSSRVSILDCRSNSWHKAPKMHVARDHPFAIAIDGKIVVKGGLEIEDLNEPKWTEVFDLKTQTWTIDSRTCGSEEWQSLDHAGMAWQVTSSCVIDNVLYFYRNGELKWFDDNVREWKIVKGLDGLPKFLFGRRTSCYVQLVDYGGKMAFLWDRHCRSNNVQGRMISCAVIALERCNRDEIWGTVEWSDAVLKVPQCFSVLHVLAATV